MNRSHLIGATHVAVLTLLAMTANAELHGRLETFRGSGIYQAYYDDQLDITWTADANLAMTRGDDDNGRMNWTDANAWATSLEINGIDGWRLPSMDINGGSTIVDCSLATQTACKDNEYGHLYNYGDGPQLGGGITPSSPGPFNNVLNSIYWSGTESVNNTAWVTGFLDGNQIESGKFNNHFAWAVRSGDVPQTAMPDLTGLTDVSGDAVPDIAHLTSDGGPRVRYFSGVSRNKIRTVPYLGSAWTGLAAATVADSDADGTADDPAVAVLAHKASRRKHVVEVRRADNGLVLNQKRSFLGPNWESIDVAVIDDLDGNGMTGDTAIAVLGVNPDKPSDEQIKVQVLRLSDGVLLANWFFFNDNWTALALEAVNRIGDSPLLAVLARKAATGASVVQARRLGDGSVQRDTSFFNVHWLARDVAILMDSNGDGTANDPAYLVLASDPATGRNKVQARRVSDGQRLNNISMLGTNWDGQRVTGVSDISGNLREEVGVLAEKRTDGTVVIQLKDFADETVTATIFP